MTFGQQTGPPASARQLQELLGLLHDAGHTDFRDARGPLGFSQRQASGKFTRAEATALIDQLQAADPEAPAPAAPAVPGARRSSADQSWRRASADDLAAELRRRGWIVTLP